MKAFLVRGLRPDGDEIIALFTDKCWEKRKLLKFSTLMQVDVSKRLYKTVGRMRRTLMRYGGPITIYFELEDAALQTEVQALIGLVELVQAPEKFREMRAALHYHMY